jgi:hypothetical protein
MAVISEIALLTTTDMQGARLDELRRLFESVEKIRRAHPDLPIRHLLLLQRCDDLAAGVALTGAPEWMEVSACAEQIPLSVARNRMLDVLLSDGVADSALVAFPDDDAWYPDGTFDHVLTAFADRPSLDLWFCRYGPQAAFDPAAVPVRPSLQQVLSFASSNTIALSGRLLKAIGGFDETLGLGTPVKSGEDTEFAMRAWLGARGILFEDARMIGHRDFSPAVRAKYYGGSLLAIARHAGRSRAGCFAFLRKLLVGVALVFKGDLPPRAMLGAWSVLFSAQRRAQAPAQRPSHIRLVARAGS